ncbi:MAG: valine--tRNA ligase [bacterium]|nr:valine--tRNA ligase [bacterium]
MNMEVSVMDIKYDHKKVEENKYDFWLKGGFFNSGDKSKDAFSIVIPPPNVTGKLHLGHAWDTTLQDIIIRRKRMQGFDTLWLPGMDHAAIATEVKVVNKLKAEGINKYELGREGFLKKAWEWKDEYALNIREQWAKLGLSLDYTKERFTLDEGLKHAVEKVFLDFYKKGFIYRGEKIINWDPVSQTALSNEEVIYRDIEGAFYHLKYYIEGTNDYLEVATTRPETLFGDTAVAVNPNDERYNKLIGKNVILPVVNKLIPIVGDEHADPNFGTGVVKITPAHDPNDYEVGNRHNLPRVKVMNPDGTMNENAGKYMGMDRFDCREQLVDDLQEAGLLIKIEPIVHSVGHSERTGVMVEPYLSKQWFVKMDELAKNVLENQKDEDKKVNFYPQRFEKILNHWMEDCHDWCISRQLWWGHRIPAWYKGEEIKVQVECPGDGWVQDEDVLDTWFSSALWPFATLGWPDSDELVKRFYPTDCLVTGYDIIFFWVCRMVFQGLEFMKERPFKDCLIHGLIRDKNGKKMSKSLGNGVDPMDVIDKYGCDSLRFFLTSNSAPGMDLRFDTEKVEAGWNYINKIWNISRYILMNTEDIKEINVDLNNLNESSKWILTKLNNLIKETDKNYDKYEFGLVSKDIYNFVWDDFASKYIEITKVDLANNNTNTKHVLLYVLDAILKLLHPFMPFVTEEIYQQIPHKCASISIDSWPKDNGINSDLSNIDRLFDLITLIRTIRNDNNKPMSKELNFITVANNKDIKNSFIELSDYIKRFTNCGSVNVSLDTPDGKYQVFSKLDFTIYIKTDDLVNLEEEKAKINKELERLESEINRASNMLANPNFTNKAPEAKVNAEREKLEAYTNQYNALKERLKSLDE